MMERQVLAAMLLGGTGEISGPVVDVAEQEGLAPLLAASPSATQAAPPIRARLRTILVEAETLALVRDRELRRVLEALHSAGLRPLVIKGAHLAHVIYSSPALRPSGDVDLLIAQRDTDRVAAVLQALGYRRPIHVRGTLILGQSHFEYVEPSGVSHAFDVHWRVAAPLVFRHVLPADAALHDARPIPALGPAAHGPSLPHALVIACVHLVAHHRDAAFLLWLYEIVTLAGALNDADADVFIAAASTAHIRAVCRAALQRTGAFCHSERVRDLMVRLDDDPSVDEPSARTLSVRSRMDELQLDLRVAHGWRERVVLLKEHFWPDAAYMRATRPAQEWLVAGYVRRAVHGARRWQRVNAAIRQTAESDAPRADSAAASARRAPSRTSR